ncbi:MAG: HNH endonuclease [Gemmataceae bacterium]
MTWALPTPEEQVQFLRNLQRILGEGLFTSTYKFALIRAIADLAVLKGDDTGAPLDIDTSDIAVRFAELYWRQARPFPLKDQLTLILRQNRGGTAEVVSKIQQAQQASGGSLFRFQETKPAEWRKLVASIKAVVCEMPLWKLQTVGEERLNFLYENVGNGGTITLKPGVAYCFRAFYELVRDLIEGAWIRFIQGLNTDRLGAVVDLGAFLFGIEPGSLDAYRPILMDVQRGACLYCGKTMAGDTHVDHFIPWSRYPADLGHNFVLAHDRCNSAKSDYLASEKHLSAWVERNLTSHDELDERLSAAGLPADLQASQQIAKWIYQQTEDMKGQVWVAGSLLRPLDPSWAACFAA